MIRRFLAILAARNLEFVRDRGSLGWNFVLPLLLVTGLAFVFSGEGRPLFKVGVVAPAGLERAEHPFLETRYVQFFEVEDEATALQRLSRHRMDMLLDPGTERYWINLDSPNGYVTERLLLQVSPDAVRGTVQGEAVQYVDWLLPGILGMNMMFSCLFGVGYVIVRYRKNGFLKRLRATPLGAAEFLTAQVVSRFAVIMVVTAIVYVASSWAIGFRMEGSYVALVLLAAFGAMAMISMGLLVATRTTSEELAGGLLNFLSWPMMLLSEVWFSMEGAHPVMQEVSGWLPLTQMLQGAREVMLDGAGLGDVTGQIAMLAVMSAVFLGLSALAFRWGDD